MIGKGIWGYQPGSSAKTEKVTKAKKAETPPEAKVTKKKSASSSKTESKDSGKK